MCFSPDCIGYLKKQAKNKIIASLQYFMETGNRRGSTASIEITTLIKNVVAWAWVSKWWIKSLILGFLVPNSLNNCSKSLHFFNYISLTPTVSPQISSLPTPESKTPTLKDKYMCAFISTCVSKQTKCGKTREINTQFSIWFGHK